MKVILYIAISILTVIAFFIMLTILLTEFLLITIWKEFAIACNGYAIGFFGEIKKQYQKISKL